jgi:hypothetical protein
MKIRRRPTRQIRTVFVTNSFHGVEGASVFPSGASLLSYGATPWWRKKYWEIIARNIKKRSWSLGCVLAIDSNGRTIWTADVHRDDGKRFVVHADEKLTAFLELEAAICACGF